MYQLVFRTSYLERESCPFSNRLVRYSALIYGEIMSLSFFGVDILTFPTTHDLITRQFVCIAHYVTSVCVHFETRNVLEKKTINCKTRQLLLN